MVSARFQFAIDNFDEGVRYFECRFAPQLHAGWPPEELSLEDVIRSVNKGFARAKHEYNASLVKHNPFAPPYGMQSLIYQPCTSVPIPLPPEYGIIVCAMRDFNRHFSPYYRRLLDMFAHQTPRQVQGAAQRLSPLYCGRGCEWLVCNLGRV